MLERVVMKLKKSLINTNDLRCMLKIVRLMEKMVNNGYKYQFTRSEFQEILYIFNAYMNLYGKVQDYERNKENEWN